MIIKTLRKKTPKFRGLIEYVLTDGGRSTPESSFTIYHNLYGIDVDVMSRQFEDNAKTIPYYATTKGYHEILSWAPSDEKHLTHDALHDFAEKYIALRGESGLCLAKAHFSTSHPHIHFVFSARDFTGKMSLKLSQKDFFGIRKKMESYQILNYPELGSLVYQHFGRQSPLKRLISPQPGHNEAQTAKRLEGKTNKKRLSKMILKTFQDSDTIGDAIASLSSMGISFHQRNGISNGVVIGKKKYRFSALGVSHPFIEQLNRSESLVKHKSNRSRTIQRHR